MDRLPPSLRRLMHETTIEYDPREVQWRLNSLIKAGAPAQVAETLLVESYLQDEKKELREFALHWPSRLGQYPAVAAGASVMRYDARVA